MTEILITVEVIFKRMPIPSLTAVHMPSTRTLGGTVALALILSYVFFDFFFFYPETILCGLELRDPY